MVDIIVEYRWADGKYNQLSNLAADLASCNVQVIAASFTAAAVAAKRATSTIPIPLNAGLIPSLIRPAGNVTGVTFLSGVAGTKRLGLLRELVPATKIFGVLINPSNPLASDSFSKDVPQAAHAIGLQMLIFTASAESEINTSFMSMVEQHVDALIVGPDAFLFGQRDQIIDLAIHNAIPAMYEWPEFVRARGLMSYGASRPDAFPQDGNYASRILKGEKPADLPVLQSVKFDFMVNLTT